VRPADRQSLLILISVRKHNPFCRCAAASHVTAAKVISVMARSHASMSKFDRRLFSVGLFRAARCNMMRADHAHHLHAGDSRKVKADGVPAPPMPPKQRRMVGPLRPSLRGQLVPGDMVEVRQLARGCRGSWRLAKVKQVRVSVPMSVHTGHHRHAPQLTLAVKHRSSCIRVDLVRWPDRSRSHHRGSCSCPSCNLHPSLRSCSPRVERGVIPPSTILHQVAFRILKHLYH